MVERWFPKPTMEVRILLYLRIFLIKKTKSVKVKSFVFCFINEPQLQVLKFYLHTFERSSTNVVVYRQGPFRTLV